MKPENITIVIAHYGLDKKISEAECLAALTEEEKKNHIFIDFEAGSAKLSELYDLAFDNIALSQQRKFAEIVEPILKENPQAKIAYFGFVPIPTAFHFGYLIGNTNFYTIYQWHHKKMIWFKEIEKPTIDYEFIINPLDLPKEKQKGKGDVVIRVATSYAIEPNSTNEVVPNPENEFDISLKTLDVDSLYSQENIHLVLDAFQRIIDAYSNYLSGRERIHLFIASSVGLPFALGTRINLNVCPYIQTYQFSRSEIPQYKEAVLIVKDADIRTKLSEDQRETASKIRHAWQVQLEDKLKPFISTISGKKPKNWLEMICADTAEYKTVLKHLKHPWSVVTDIDKTTLKHDEIDTEIMDVDGGFEYIEQTNKWQIDDGFLFGLKKRLDKKPESTDIMQASRLFFFHEALHYSEEGHYLTKELATGIGQFPKVIEEADYQADVWGLLTEYKYCTIFEKGKLKDGHKNFFCNAIETAVETMWSFVDTDEDLNRIQVRSMNRFLNWYWQWLRIESIKDKGTLEDIICILLDKPIIEFAGAPMELSGSRVFYKLNSKLTSHIYQIGLFAQNKVYRFASNNISDLPEGFRKLDGEKIKTALKSYQVQINFKR